MDTKMKAWPDKNDYTFVNRWIDAAGLENFGTPYFDNGLWSAAAYTAAMQRLRVAVENLQEIRQMFWTDADGKTHPMLEPGHAQDHAAGTLKLIGELPKEQET